MNIPNGCRIDYDQRFSPDMAGVVRPTYSTVEAGGFSAVPEQFLGQATVYSSSFDRYDATRLPATDSISASEAEWSFSSLLADPLASQMPLNAPNNANVAVLLVDDSTPGLDANSYKRNTPRLKKKRERKPQAPLLHVPTSESNDDAYGSPFISRGHDSSEAWNSTESDQNHAPFLLSSTGGYSNPSLPHASLGLPALHDSSHLSLPRTCPTDAPQQDIALFPNSHHNLCVSTIADSGVEHASIGVKSDGLPLPCSLEPLSHLRGVTAAYGSLPTSGIPSLSWESSTLPNSQLLVSSSSAPVDLLTKLPPSIDLLTNPCDNAGKMSPPTSQLSSLSKPLTYESYDAVSLTQYDHDIDPGVLAYEHSDAQHLGNYPWSADSEIDNSIPSPPVVFIGGGARKAKNAVPVELTPELEAIISETLHPNKKKGSIASDTVCHECNRDFKTAGKLRTPRNLCCIFYMPFLLYFVRYRLHPTALLRQHVRANAHKREFPCPLCSLTFSERANLKRHVKHMHLQQRDFPCPIPGCIQAFNRKSHLVHHLSGAKHSDEEVRCYCDESLQAMIVENSMRKRRR